MSNNQFTLFFYEMQSKFSCVIKDFKPVGFAISMLLVMLKPKRIQQVCPRCGCEVTYIHEHDTKKIRGGSYSGVPVIFEMDRIRYKCSKCSKTFVEKYDCIPAGHFITTETENYILWQLGSTSMLQIAESIGVSEQTIASRAIEYGESESKIMLKSRYKYLSMDEVFIGRTKENKHAIYWVLNDISVKRKTNNVMLSIGRTKEDVIKHLSQLAYPNDVRAVCIDMWEPYKEAISERLPQAAIVIDKFHVIKNAEERMNNVRKQANCSKEDKSAMKKDAGLFLSSIYKLDETELERLETYLNAASQIEKMYFILQELLQFYNIRGYDEALDYLCKWESSVINSGVKEALSLYEMIYKWLPYIMNYFNFRITNGKTEGKNNLIRQIDRMGFHYGLKCLQGCLYAHDRKQEYLKWKKYQKKLQKDNSATQSHKPPSVNSQNKDSTCLVA